MSEFNLDLAERVLEQITLHPETHYQPSHLSCVVGWTVQLANSEERQVLRDYTGRMECSYYSINSSERAAVMLGVEPRVTLKIFNTMSGRLARRQLKRLIYAELKRRKSAAKADAKAAKAAAKAAAKRADHIEEETQRSIDLQARAQVRAARVAERSRVAEKVLV